MEDTRLGVVETRFAELVWSHAPIASGELVKLCQKELEWEKPTTYTVLRKLCERGLFRNEGGTVSVVVTREEYYSAKSRQFVAETFDGSLPAFLAAFTGGKTLSAADAAELQALIDRAKEGNT